jgi:hypothetical protein
MKVSVNLRPGDNIDLCTIDLTDGFGSTSTAQPRQRGYAGHMAARVEQSASLPARSIEPIRRAGSPKPTGPIANPRRPASCIRALISDGTNLRSLGLYIQPSNQSLATQEARLRAQRNPRNHRTDPPTRRQTCRHSLRTDADYFQRLTSTTNRPRSVPSISFFAASTASPSPISVATRSIAAASRSRASRS